MAMERAAAVCLAVREADFCACGFNHLLRSEMHISHGGIHYAAREEPDGTPVYAYAAAVSACVFAAGVAFAYIAVAVANRAVWAAAAGVARRTKFALAERNGWQVELFRHKAQALSNCPYSHSTPQQPAMRQQLVADTQP